MVVFQYAGRRKYYLRAIPLLLSGFLLVIQSTYILPVHIGYFNEYFSQSRGADGFHGIHEIIFSDKEFFRAS
jgi:hypothetical protein